MAPQNQSNQTQSRYQQLWCQIREQGRCTTLTQFNSRQVPCESRLDRFQIYWNWPRLELQSGRSKIINERIRTESIKRVPSPTPRKPVNGPTPYTAPIYGKSVQYAPTEEAKTLTDKQIRHVQEVCGKFLYQARTVDSTMIHALNELCIAATKGTAAT